MVTRIVRRLGVLAHIRERLLRRAIEEFLDRVVVASDGSDERGGGTDLPRGLVGEDSQRGGQPVVVQEGWAQLEHEPAGAFGRLLERRPGEAERGLEPLVSHLARDQCDAVHRDQRRGHHLDCVVVQRRCDAAALLLLCPQHAGQDRPPMPLALGERELDLEPLGDVTGDHRRRHHAPVRVVHRGHGDRDLHQAPVLSLSDRLVMVDSLAGPNPAQNLGHLGVTVIGHHDRDMSADRLRDGEPVQTL